VLEERQVSPDNNRKYEAEYCELLTRASSEAYRHCAMANALQPRVEALALGYDLRVGSEAGFGCIQDVLAGAPLTSLKLCDGIEPANAALAHFSPGGGRFHLVCRIRREARESHMPTVENTAI